MGEHSLSLTKSDEKLSVLTHCNAGALATAGYGTAVGVIRSLHAAGRLKHVYVDETRPYMQGTRLTAYELASEGIPHSLIVDSSAAFLMQQGKINFVVTGADRIAANGDAANKIGTYSVAVNAHYHGIPFYIAAPETTFDLKIATGAGIPVEMRGEEEIVSFRSERIAPEKTTALNPSFDVTPHKLIAGIITEYGVIKPPYQQNISNILPNHP